MMMQPARLQWPTERLLFTAGPRLGWVFRDRRQLITPYAEPEPDPQAVAGQVTARRERAERAWRFSLRWVARPLLPLAVALYGLGELARDVTHRAHSGQLAWVPIALAVAGVAWPAWCLARLLLARNADPVQAQQAALQEWRQQAGEHEQAELARLGGVPEWASATSPALRTDVYGGTLGGWQSLLAVHGASILAEAIHAGTPGAATRAERAVDVRVAEQVITALGGDLTPARLAAAVQAALGQPVPPGLLTAAEAEQVGADLFGESYRAQVGPSLVRLDAFISDLARYAGPRTSQPAPPAWYTCLALGPGARSASTELLTALAIQWLTVAVTRSTATAPAVVIAGADEVSRDHLEALAGACEWRGVPLTLLFRHLRDDATALIGGAATTAFMRLGNHQEADAAAAFIGRHYKFTVSGWTVTRGGEHSQSRTGGYSHGISQSRGSTSSRGWNSDGLWDQTASGGHTSSRDHGRSQEWSQSDATSDGASWSTAQSIQRTYEYAVEPAFLQNLAASALLLPAHGTASRTMLAVECDPHIIELPDVAAALAASADPRVSRPVASPGSRPELVPPRQPPGWQPRPDPALAASPRRPRGGQHRRD